MHRLLAKAPLRMILIIPFVLQVSAAVGLTAWLSIRNGQQAVNEVTRQLREETTARVSHEVGEILSTAQAINQLQAKAIQRESLNLDKIRSLEDMYWDYINTFPFIQGLGAGNQSGDILALFQRGKAGNITYFLEYSTPETQQQYVSLQLDRDRQVVQAETLDRYIDSRQRPWYQAAARAEEPVWTAVYPSISAVEGHSLAINASRPIYGGEGQLQGVVSVILDLGQISQLLGTIEFSPSGQVYILEADGNLIGSSDGNNPVYANGGAIRRLPATQSEDPLIRASANYLHDLLGENLGAVDQPLQTEFKLNGERQFVQITSVPMSDQLQWYVVVAAPESDFMEQIYAQRRNTLLLCLVALALATGSGIATARWLTGPLLKLSQAAKNIAQGHWKPQERQGAMEVAQPREINDLAQSFDQMARQLNTSFAALQASEASFRSIATNVPGVILRYVLHPDGSDAVLYASPGCRPLLGIEAKAIEKNVNLLWELIHPDDRPAIKATIATSAQTLKTWHSEWRLTTPAGQQKWLRGAGNPMRQPNRDIVWITVVSDISDRKAAEQALTTQRDFNCTMAEITSRFVDVDPAILEAEITRALQDLAKVTGVNASYVATFNPATHSFSMTHGWCQGASARLLPQGQELPYDAFPWSMATLQDRRVVHVPNVAKLPPAAAVDQASWQKFQVVAVLLVPLIQKSVVTGFMGFTSTSQPFTWGNDVIQQLKVMGQTMASAQKHVQTQAALMESEARWQFALEGSGHGVWDWNAQTNRVFFSRQWKTLLGYEDHEIGTGLDEWDSRIHPDDKTQCYEDLQAHFTGKTPIYQNEHRVRCKDNQYRWILDRGKVIEWTEAGYPLRVIGTHTDISDRKRAEAQLIYNALHDDLTDLPNRALFTNRLDLALQRAQQSKRYHFAVLFLDLDRFKVINDSLGHLVGDQLLVTVAHKLQRIVRPTDIAARLGGDEFVILLEDLVDVQASVQVAQRLLTEFEAPIAIDDHQVFINTSIGIVWGNTASTSAADLLRDADIALYRAKAQGRGRYEIFDADMHAQAVKRMTLEHDLRQTIHQQGFTIHYQPIVDLNTRRLTGFEALIRWPHPTRGFISPAEFIPVAEETGMIMPISRWMLQTVCQQLASWRQQFAVVKDLRVSVNLSSQDLFQTHLVETVQQILMATQLSPNALTLEITESVLIENVEAAIHLLQQLRAKGIHISIDDFGTGYSSLSYLYNLPVDSLKIDQSFVSQMQMGDKNYKIVQAVVGLSDQLQLAAIAEGIETEQQLEWLKTLDCELGQGYLFSKPLTADAAGDLLARGGRFSDP